MARAQDRGLSGRRWGKVALPADDEAANVAASPAPETTVGLGHAGRVLIAAFGTWLAFVAIPDALPWNSADDGDRALIGGAAITTALALLSIPISLRWRTGWATGFAWLGLAAALFGMGLATVQVVRVLLVPAGVSKSTVLGVGLLALLTLAFLLTWRRQVFGISTTVRISTLSLVGSIVALILIAAYLLVTNSLLNLVKAPADDWARYTDLRNGLEALAFGAAGALLGTTIQKQATDRATARAEANLQAATANYVVATRALDLLERPPAEPNTPERAAIARQELAAEYRELREDLQLPH